MQQKFPDDQKIMEMYHSGDHVLAMQAKEIMISKYSRFIYSLIRKHNIQQDIEDCAQEGRERLLQCLQHYDVRKATFLTYCKFHIEDAILEMDRKLHSPSESRYVQRTLAAIYAAEASLRREGRAVSTENLAELTGFSHRKIKCNLDRAAAGSVSLDELDLSVCLDGRPDGSEHGREWDTPEYIFIQREEQELLRRVFSRLEPEKQEILQMRIIEGKSYASIARRTGQSVYFVKKYCREALEQMREDEEVRRWR